MSNVDIYTILSSKPHDSYFLTHYYKFILACCQANSLKTKEEIGYTEKHHICPKAKDLFPEYRSLRDHPWNKAILTGDQHFIAHKLLWKAYGGSQTSAFWMMSKHVKDNKSYTEVRLDITNDTSKRMQGHSTYKNSDGITFWLAMNDPKVISGEVVPVNTGKTNRNMLHVDKEGNKIICEKTDPRVISGEFKHFLTGIERNQQFKDRASASKRANPYRFSDIQKEAQRQKMLGRKATDEIKRKMSIARKGKPKSKETIKRRIETVINKRFDLEIVYTFFNKITNQTYIGKRLDLEMEIGFALSALVRQNKPEKSIKGWCLIKNQADFSFPNSI